MAPPQEDGTPVYSTLVMERGESGDWVVTQHGVPVEGRGQTAAEAAARYCKLVSGESHD